MDATLLTEDFEAERSRLWAIAYRLTGHPDDADDVLQAAWIKAEATDKAGTEIVSPAGWLSAVASREALDVLRRRRRRAEVPLDDGVTPIAMVDGPEDDAVHVESVGRALLVVLNRMTPAQRVAYVLHDMFDFPFALVAEILDTSPAAAKKLASRARRQLDPPPSDAGAQADHEIVDAYLEASRSGDIAGLLAILAPDVVRTCDPGLVPPKHEVVQGASAVAEQTRRFGTRAAVSTIGSVDGAPALLVAPHGDLRIVMLFTITEGVIVRIHVSDATHVAHRRITPV
ncbi:sigma-70 family RNA polymerase sigma factor [Gordonia sp. CPCC 206044]|uniref:sigma-70 family RNA polymerase sigma factor n=1 Tax=Gordonia sp. CPCC 206044 TaxID=3140793 RepID=UPI003AF3F8FA